MERRVLSERGEVVALSVPDVTIASKVLAVTFRALPRRRQQRPQGRPKHLAWSVVHKREMTSCQETHSDGCLRGGLEVPHALLEDSHVGRISNDRHTKVGSQSGQLRFSERAEGD